jgi:roadblock/LC7 domain-containing protein
MSFVLTTSYEEEKMRAAERVMKQVLTAGYTLYQGRNFLPSSSTYSILLF